ncbi:hypothetical protein FV139_02565 [Parahaliea maris]|uniref:Uncharacterized protein n=1 Tax=Parahaliea maris TaxID=2716870 RepID=A0A5C9A6P1_9GAMM|nr:hypothetical protein [Parahaliea maris]TXS96396.1 hypothetical protein FV139_02565 [Parahaliea maris]
MKTDIRVVVAALLASFPVLQLQAAVEGDEITGTVINDQFPGQSDWPSPVAIVSFSDVEFSRVDANVTTSADFAEHTLTLNYENTSAFPNITYAPLVFVFEDIAVDSGTITSLAEVSNTFSAQIATSFTEDSITIEVDTQNTNPGDVFTLVLDVGESSEPTAYSVEFTGTVFSVGSNLGDEIMANDAVYGCVDYRDGIEDTDPSETVGRYVDAVTNFQLSVGDAASFSGQPGVITVWDDAFNTVQDFFSASVIAEDLGVTVGGEDLLGFQFGLGGQPGDTDILFSADIPSAEELLAFDYFTSSNDVNWMRFSADGGDGDQQNSIVRWSLDSVTPRESACAEEPPVELTPEEALVALMAELSELDIHKGVAKSLNAKLRNALSRLQDGNTANDHAAANKLKAFINAVSAQSGKKIPEVDAEELIAAAEAIIAAINDPGSAVVVVLGQDPSEPGPEFEPESKSEPKAKPQAKSKPEPKSKSKFKPQK